MRNKYDTPVSCTTVAIQLNYCVYKTNFEKIIFLDKKSELVIQSIFWLMIWPLTLINFPIDSHSHATV